MTRRGGSRTVGALLALGVVGALAGCADDACAPVHLDAYGQVQRTPGGGYALPMVANGQTLRMVIDTGAVHTALTAEAADRAGFRPVPLIPGTFDDIGVGGSSELEVVNAKDVSIPGGRLADMMAVSLSSLHFPRNGADGLLGDDILAHWDLDLDLGDRFVAFEEPQGCAVPTAPWTGLATRVPVDNSHGSLRLDAMLDGTPVTAVLDTGAARTLVTPDVANLSTSALAADPMVDMVGIAGRPVHGPLHRFHDLVIAGRSFGPVRAVVGPVPGVGVGMLLGADFMSHYRVDILFRSRTVFIGERLDAVPGAAPGAAAAANAAAKGAGGTGG